jgi:hypothetical protein
MIEDIKDPKNKAEFLMRKFAKLKGERVNWDSYWEKIAEYVLPRKDEVYGTVTTGEDKHSNNRLYDSTSIHSNELLASALHSMLTNPSSVWFGLSTGDKELDKQKEVRQYLQDSVRVIIQTLNMSNFQTEIHETYLDLGSIGTTTLRIEEDDERVIRFFAEPIYSSYVDENSKGIIDTIYREYEYTLRQMEQEFGSDFLNIPDMKQRYEKDPMEKVKILHAIETQKDGKIVSVHCFCDKKYILRESKFNEFPTAVPRWTKIAGEKYGRSPAMKALPDIKMLNQMQRTLIRAAQKVADPPLLIPDSGFLLPVRTTPGGSTIYRAGTKDEIKPLVHNARLDLNSEMIEQARLRIQQSFFIDQLQLQDGPQMTATEVNQRTEEKLRMMGPILGRLNNELLKPIIDRVFNILARKNLLPQAPKALAKRDLDIRYTSQIAKAQRAAEADTFTRVVQSVAPIIEMQPQIFDNINGDEVLRVHAEIFGLPEEMLRAKEQVEESRAAQAEMQQQQMQAEQENVQADTAQKLGNAGA